MTALEDAQAELAEASVPAPDWIEEDLTPTAALLYCFETTKVGLRVATAAAVSLQADPDDEIPAISALLNGCAAALAGYTHALVALEVLPKEAEEAMLSGNMAPS